MRTVQGLVLYLEFFVLLYGSYFRITRRVRAEEPVQDTRVGTLIPVRICATAIFQLIVASMYCAAEGPREGTTARRGLVKVLMINYACGETTNTLRMGANGNREREGEALEGYGVM